MGVPRNSAQALTWYRRAAEQGSDTAQNNLGWMYQYGDGVPRDYAEALTWYRQAIEHPAPDPNAYGHLGVMYEMGQGVPQDLVQAYAWYSIGAGQSGMARALRDDLEKRLTPAQVADALEGAREWQARHPPR